jgi:hypothetical protein
MLLPVAWFGIFFVNFATGYRMVQNFSAEPCNDVWTLRTKIRRKIHETLVKHFSFTLNCCEYQCYNCALKEMNDISGKSCFLRRLGRKTTDWWRIFHFFLLYL